VTQRSSLKNTRERAIVWLALAQPDGPGHRLPGMKAIIGLLLFTLAACSTRGPSVTPAISETAARDVALRSTTSSTPPSFVAIRLSTYGRESYGGSVVAASTPVWSVLVAGSFPFSCGPYTATPRPCPSPATTERVLVDAQTGSFIEGLSPAP
jgi:hypothetical protein